MSSGEISAMVLTGLIMAALAFISFKIGRKIGDDSDKK
jgi:hypothetical protein